MRNTMTANPTTLASTTTDKLIALGGRIRAHRKALRISATAAAEAAGMSRVTLHRIEKGEPSVTMGAYLSAMAVLNMDFGVIEPAANMPSADRTGWIPARIDLADYPQLKQLAWQVHSGGDLTPTEALSIYERNWRHVDVKSLEPREQQLIDALRSGLGGQVGTV